MLEKIISKFMMHYLKGYIETINSSQMETKLWKGHAKFENLSLLPTALMTHLVPLRVVRGTVKRIEVNFPWKNLSTKPCVIEIEDVFMVCVPDIETWIKIELQAHTRAFKTQKTEGQVTENEEENAWQSILETAMDNAIVNIKNIHIRIEYVEEFSAKSLGFFIPSITLHTVDENGEKLGIVSNVEILRKKLLISGLSIYFDVISDPIDVTNFNEEMQRLITSGQHQYVFDPLNIETILIHDRRKTADYINTFEVMFQKINIQLDYMQTRAIMELNKFFRKTARRIRYIHCIRPKKFRNTDQYWKYAHRCANAKNDPLQFIPNIALQILKNRKSYISRLRKVKDKTGFNDKHIQKIEKNVGEACSLFLREYADAVLEKEQREADAKFSASDMIEIQHITEQNQTFFKTTSYQICAKIPSITVGLQFVENISLFTAEFNNINLNVESNVNELFMKITMKDLILQSYVDETPLSLFAISMNDTDNFFTLLSHIPNSDQPASTKFLIKPCSFIVDPRTVNKVIDFFYDNTQAEANPDEVRINRIDGTESLRKLMSYKNHRITLQLDCFDLIIPFEHEMSKENLRFSIKEFQIVKTAETIIKIDAPIIPLNFHISLIIDELSFGSSTIIQPFEINYRMVVQFYNLRQDIDFKSKLKIGDIIISFSHDQYECVPSLVKAFQAILMVSSADLSDTRTVITYSKVKTSFEYEINKVGFGYYGDEGIKASIMKLSGNLLAFINILNLRLDIREIDILKMNNDPIIQLNNLFELTISDVQKQTQLGINIFEPVAYFDGIWIQWLVNLVMKIVGSFPADDNAVKPFLPICINIFNPSVVISGTPINITLEQMIVRNPDQDSMEITFDNLFIRNDIIDFLTLTAFNINIKNNSIVEIAIPIVDIHMKLLDFSPLFWAIAKIVDETAGFQQQNTGNSAIVNFKVDEIKFSASDEKQKQCADFKVDCFDLHIENNIVNFYTKEIIGEIMKIEDKISFSYNMNENIVDMQIPVLYFNVDDVFMDYMGRVMLQNYPIIQPPSANLNPLSVHMSFKELDMIMRSNTETFCTLNVPMLDMKFILSYTDPMDLSFGFDSLSIKSNILWNTTDVLTLDKFILKMANNKFEFNHDALLVNISFPLIIKLVSFMMPFMIVDFSKFSPPSDKVLEPMDVDASLQKLIVNITPIKRLGRSMQLSVSNISAHLDKGSGPIVFDSIELASDNKDFMFIGPLKMQLSETVANIELDRIEFMYTHKIGHTIIDCFIAPGMIIQAPAAKEEKKQVPTNTLEIVAQINKIKISLEDVSHVVVFNVNSIKFHRQHIVWNASVHNIEVIPAESFSIKNEILTMDKDTPLLSFVWTDDEMEIKHSRTNIYCDIPFFVELFSFLMVSPLLHIPTLASATPNPNKISIPFHFKLQLCGLNLIIPIDTTNYLNLSFELDGGFYQSTLSASITKLTIALSNPIFPPIIKDLSVMLQKLEFVDSSTISIDIHLPEINVLLNPYVLIGIYKIYKSIEDLFKSIVLASDISNQREENNTAMFADLKFSSSNIMVVMYRDNLTEVFKLVVPPIKFRLNSDENLKIAISISPYFSYFNESTGQWDLMIEPWEIKVEALLTQTSLGVKLISENSLNINLPTTALIQYRNLLNEIQGKNSIKSITLDPELSISNLLVADFQFNYFHNQEKFELCIKPNKTEVLQSIDNDSNIEINGISIKICDIIYPKLISNSLSVVRKPHKGGTLIEVLSPLQIKNCLKVPIDIFDSNKMIFCTLRPNQRYALTPENHEFIFGHPGEQPVKLSLSLNDPVFFYISQEMFYCVIIPSLDSPAASKVFTITAAVNGVNFLPVPLHIKLSDNLPITVLKENGSDQILNASANQFTAQFSLDGESFTPPVTVRVSTFVKQAEISCDFDDNLNSKMAVICETEDNKTTTVYFYVPSVLFNLTKHAIRLTEEVNIFKKPTIYEIQPGLFCNWCPPSFFSDNTKLLVQIDIPNLTRPVKLDLLLVSQSVLFLPLLENEKLFVPIRYSISSKKKTSVVTFSTMLQIQNYLEDNIMLQSIACIPKTYDSRAEHIGLASCAEVIGSAIMIDGKREFTVNSMTLSGAFLFYVAGCSTSPAVNLTTPQKNVFRMQCQESYRLIELEVIDAKTTYITQIRETEFPTPILISNMLSNHQLIAYQLITANPFVVEPNSTSFFAYDEPFAYPNIHILIDDLKLNISMLEDTKMIKLRQNLDGNPLYAQVKRNGNLTRSLIISDEPEETKERFNMKFDVSLKSIMISVIDLQMREFALVSLSNVQAIIDNLAFKFKIGNLQIDDQNPLAPNPVVFHGRNDFIEINGVLPYDTVFGSGVTYLMCVLQRIDGTFDSAFLSDVIAIATALTKPIKHVIAPLQPVMNNKPHSLITINWLEISPIYLIIQYKNNTSRPVLMGPLNNYVRFIPSINVSPMLLPGLLITQTTDELKFIADKISIDYKTAAFNQILDILGTSGKLLKSLGIAAAIADALDIQMKSELTDFSQIEFSRREEEEFDNRIEIQGCFSEETIFELKDELDRHQISPSNTIIGVELGKETGLKIKEMPCCGFGHGVVGVQTKSSIDLHKELKAMEGTERMRSPRAFPDNRIGVYDPTESLAQTLCQSKSRRTQKIRLMMKNDVFFICVSDLNLFLLDAGITKVVQKIPINMIESIEIGENELKLVVIKVMYISKETKIIKSEESNKIRELGLFLESQKRMLSQFNATLLC